MTVHEQIRAAREALGLSRSEVARRLGIGQSAYSRIESGQHAIRLETLQRVADVLGANFLVVVEGHDTPVTPRVT